jgi:Uma2 family endonuclease
MSSSMAKDILRRHRLTIEAYHRMGEAGILPSGARVELIDGELIDMPPIGSRHAGTVNHVDRILQRAVGDRAVVQIQNPIVLGMHSELLPDLALVRPRQDFYKSSHPRAEDVLLIIEVAESSLRYDTEIKVPLYAHHDVPEVWIVDLERECLTRYLEPTGGEYQRSNTLELMEPVSPTALRDVRVDLSGLF